MNSITARTETEALLHEKFQALLADLDTAGNKAQYGHVLDALDDYLFLYGRKFLTEILQSKIQDRITADEAKQCPHCKKNGSPQNEDENADDEQQSHHDFPPSSPLQFLPSILVSRRSTARS